MLFKVAGQLHCSQKEAEMMGMKMMQRFWISHLVAIRILAGLVLAGLLFSLAAADTRRASNGQELLQAISASTDGMVIELAPGDYGVLSLQGFKAGTSVTLRSKDLARPARFSAMTLREVTGLTFENVVFDYDFEPGDKINLRPFQIADSQNIILRNVIFDGDVARGRSSVDDGFPTAFGLSVRNSTNIVLEHSEIRNFFRGSVMSQSRNLIVRGNNIHSIRMDGMNFAEVQTVRIEDNHIHDFIRNLKSKDHSDMIQFWTANTNTPSRDVVIRNNVLSSGSGWYTQSIFMRNEKVDKGQAGQAMFYQDITIEENVIFNAHAHGITVGETDRLVVRHNSLIRNARSEGEKKSVSLWVPRISIAPMSRRVTIQNNVTSSIKGQKAQSDWRVDGNVFIQNHSRNESGFYTSVFTNTLRGAPSDLRSFYAKKGGAIDRAGAGAARLRP